MGNPRRLPNPVRTRRWRRQAVAVGVAAALLVPTSVSSVAETTGDASIPATAVGATPPADVAPMVAAAAAPVCELASRVAVVQDVVPWSGGSTGWGGAVAEAVAQDAACQLTSDQLGTVDLDRFDVVVIASAQTQEFYNRLFPGGSVHGSLGDFAANGGVVVANLADRASGPGNGGSWGSSTFIGGLRQISHNWDDNSILNPSHPIVNGGVHCLDGECGAVADRGLRDDLDGWNSSSHGYFVDLPDDANVVLGAPTLHRPAMVTYPWGLGHVVATTLTLEWRHVGGLTGSLPRAPELLANEIAYARTLAACTGTADGDCDGLDDPVEADLGTDPKNPDTDGDGLLDGWEAPPGTPGAGFRIVPGGDVIGSSGRVLGPFAVVGAACPQGGGDLRIPDSTTCMNHPPDPLRKDAYVEIDWQDCEVGDCPDFDNTHHAPSLEGLQRVVDAFADAPVANPDGSTGVNLNLLIDEALPHDPNCDQDQAVTRKTSFGGGVGGDPDVLAARERSVRYLWSGHSSRKATHGDCPSPTYWDFGMQGFGRQPLPDYDWSPFGDANIGGRDLLVTLGPLWSCPADIPGTLPGWPGSCYRRDAPGPLSTPGIFPAQARDQHGEVFDAPWPIAMLLGQGESAGISQLWARSTMHLLGHAMGLPDDASVGNRVDVAFGANPASFRDWDGLQLAPQGVGVPAFEGFADYQALVDADADNDGVAEGDDLCPGTPSTVWLGTEQGDILIQPDEDGDGFGDACDQDLDGDGLTHPPVGAPVIAVASDDGHMHTHTTESEDTLPFDTDNDGTDNVDDPDDDGDEILDDDDNCRLVGNPDQADLDGDGVGDGCDGDVDGDGQPDGLELWLGTDPRDPQGEPEILGLGGACADGIDNDLDGLVDDADGGCFDTDGDTAPDALDNCPDVPNFGWWDTDGDGIGNRCETEGFDFEGFFSPVRALPELNEMKAGRAIPMKFSLGGDEGLDVIAEGSPVSWQVACGETDQLTDVSEATTAGGSGLQYDAAEDLYTYVWDTDREWAGTCRVFRLRLTDGNVHEVRFSLR